MKFYLIISLFIVSSISYSQSRPNIEKLDDAVVMLIIYDNNGNPSGWGSGFFLDSKGTIATNYHVVKNAISIKVIVVINGIQEIFDVEKIFKGDEEKDLATVLIKNSNSNSFPFLTLESDLPNKGEDCWSIGSPDSPENMNRVSKGIISNIHLEGIKNWTGIMLDIDAGIAHGSSGGVLINSLGKVIGITCGGGIGEDAARAGINYAISSRELNNLPIIDKKSLVDPKSILCELGFFTNYPYSGDAYLYIDGIYVGSFSSYFPDNFEPTCYEDGTITKSLIAGNHSYSVYYSKTGKRYSGSLTLQPGECQMLRVGAKYYTSTVTPPKSSDLSNNRSYFKPQEGLNYFSNEFRFNFNLDSDILKNMQFYLSDEIILMRGERTNDIKQIDANGNVSISNSAKIDEVVIKKNSLGTCVKVIDGNKIAVSFDNDDNKYLVFGDPNNMGRYRLMAAEWKDGKGKINYGDKVYYVMPGGASASLEFMLKIDADYKLNSNKIKGRTISGKSISDKSNLQTLTSSIRTNYLNDFDIKNVQFFLSSEVTLEDNEKPQEAIGLNEKGDLVYISNKNTSKNVIPKYTPGVCVKVIDDNKIAVSFDPTNQNKYLVFGDPNNKGKYSLLGAEWVNGKGKVNYGDKVYYVMPGGASAFLLLKFNLERNIKKSKIINSGRKVESN